jgi:NDP-sugar pyrophosphorylase family protein
VGLGAIVVIAGNDSSPSPGHLSDKTLSVPLGCVDVLGRSMLERSVDRFLRADMTAVSVLVASEHAYGIPEFSDYDDRVDVGFTEDIFSATCGTLHYYAQIGIEHSFVMSANLYTETDLLDLFYFHRESRQKTTRAIDGQAPLDLWVVDCSQAGTPQVMNLFKTGEHSGNPYIVREYVTRLSHPRDLRRLSSDGLNGRQEMRPCGRESRSGIWIADGAQIHRRARIVGPAFIGRNSELREDVLITRCSSIEKNCCVDYGSVVEDSSILANTHLGIWLDVRHSVAEGSKLFNLERGVVLEFSDPGIMHSNGLARKRSNGFALSPRKEIQPVISEPQTTEVQPVIAGPQTKEELPAPEAWQLGANLIQG